MFFTYAFHKVSKKGKYLSVKRQRALSVFFQACLHVFPPHNNRNEHDSLRCWEKVVTRLVTAYSTRVFRACKPIRIQNQDSFFITIIAAANNFTRAVHTEGRGFASKIS